ncbi:hypothetical protein R75461_08249 [Paraburkholderia nemoris]|uniref:hypothetical protein n=1 Tax=Paraburkholderia nemoris TaxID=2793076 RepID=UPI00190B59A2|nr:MULTISPECIES: hypothetical protein [Paraburkholderia]MBK3787114.1 hypothetical protein [Paraburkholderia aspalathi]CAE6865509.1 hypothetical protein R75461_08249 [Paraburkholderia nemoris]
MTITNQRVVTRAIVLARMTPGIRYSVHQLARLVGTGMPTMQLVLAEYFVRGVLRKTIAGKRDVYWLPSADELASNQGSQWALPRGIFQGYDLANRHFQDLCLSTRARVPKA